MQLSPRSTTEYIIDIHAAAARAENFDDVLDILARPWDEYDAADLTVLTNAFSPRLCFHPRERYLPTTPERYIEASELWFHDNLVLQLGSLDVQKLSEWTKARAEDEYPDNRSDEQREEQPNRNLYLNADESVWSGVDPNELDAQVPIYARPRLITVDNDELIEICYVAFFGYNGAYRIAGCCDQGQHQADFEHCTLRIDKATGAIHSCRFGAHADFDGVWEIPGDGTIEIEDNTHVVCYVALNGHGFYNEPGTWVRIVGFANDECDEGVRWQPRAVVVSDSPDSRLGAVTPWLKYDGYWAPNDDKANRGRIAGPQQQDWWKLEEHESSTCLHRFCCFLCCAACMKLSLKDLPPRLHHLKQMTLDTIHNFTRY